MVMMIIFSEITLLCNLVPLPMKRLQHTRRGLVELTGTCTCTQVQAWLELTYC